MSSISDLKNIRHECSKGNKQGERGGKGEKREFKTTIIPLSMYGAISGALENANDEASIKRVFDDAIRYGVYA